jgi:hypothetical protein
MEVRELGAVDDARLGEDAQAGLLHEVLGVGAGAGQGERGAGQAVEVLAQ